MAWVDVEEDDRGLWVRIAGITGLVAGAGAWWQHDPCMGCLVFFSAVTLITLRRMLWLQLWLPWEARRAANVVLDWFKNRFPDARIQTVAVRAIEPKRYVIAVRHGFGSPTPRRYFAIARP